MTARGASGQLRKGYLVVARLSGWSMDGNGRVEATASDVNDLWIDDESLSLRLTVGQKQWAWSSITAVDRGQPFVVMVNGSPDTL